MSFGEKLKEYREYRNMTQEQLANKIGVAKSTIAGYEAGNRTPDVAKIKKLAAALGITGDDLLETNTIKRASSVSEEAMQMAETYDKLDIWGKRSVWQLAQNELARVQDESRFWDSIQEEPEEKVIPLFLSAPAAGMAAPIVGEDYDDYTLSKEDPQGALFAVRVSGDSMEPHFPDGSMVFCNKDPLQDGDIGVFSVDGDAVIKQYHYDRFMGITYLFSLNRKRDDADIVITRNSGRSLTCLGRVITNRRFDVPGR